MAGNRLLVHLLSPLLIIMVFGCGRGGSPKLSPAGFKVEFAGHNLPSEMTVGQRLLAAVSFKNVSTTTWPSTPNHKGLNAVNLSYHWIDKKDRTVVFDGLRTPLPHDLNPGESVRLNAAIQAPDQPGRYTLEVTLVQEGVAWFPDKGGEKLTASVIVVERGRKASEVTGSQPVTETDTPGIQSKKRIRLDKTKADRDKPTHPWAVQVGAFSREKDAETLAKKLRDKGYDADVVAAQVKGKKWHRVFVGRLASRGEAKTLQETLKTTEKLERAFIARR